VDKLFTCLDLLPQSNHRSWTDFFVDPYLTEARAQLMSRQAAALLTDHSHGTA
jgi:hypothetical protein